MIRRFFGSALCAVLCLVSVQVGAQGSKETFEPREVSRAEAAAVEMVADFLDGGAEAIYNRLAPDSPLASLAKAEALAEIETRTGPPSRVKWNLETVVPSLADDTAVFGVEFESGIDDVIVVTFVENKGRYDVMSIRSFTEPSPHALRPPWAGSELAPETTETGPPSFLVHLPFIGGLFAALSILSLAITRVRPMWGRLLYVATIVLVGVSLHMLHGELMAVARSVEPDVAAANTSASLDRLGSLLEFRRSLAAGTPLLLPGRLESRAEDDTVAVWQAQVGLRDMKYADAQTRLARFPIDTDRPMVALLRARLAAAAGDDVASSLAYERTMRLGPGRDALWLETAQWLSALGFEERALTYLDRLPEMRSRNADAWYTLASIAGGQGNVTEAKSYLRTAWRLEPVPRSEIIGTSSLAAVLRRDETMFLIPIAAPSEPSFRTEGEPALYIDVPETAGVSITGGLARFVFTDGSTLTASGGATLIGADAEVVDALTIRRRSQEASLDDLERLLVVGRTASALAHPAVRERFVRTASALAERHRWEDIDRLTASFSPSSEGVPPDLLFLRGHALRRLGREREVKQLLAELFASPAMQRRNDPRVLYQFGELLAAMELYTPAIRTLERVDAMIDDVSFDDHIRRLSMNQRLAERYSEYMSPNFVYHYPDNLDTETVEALAHVMEAELARLRKIIPLSEFRKTTVNILWWGEFRSTYTGSDHILGFYDGKITLPLAGISSLEPPIVALMTHELTHAVIAQATNDRAPAWIQEGLAQRVEMIPYHANSFNMYEEHRMLPIALLSSALTSSVDVDLIGQAYVTSQTAIRFLEAQYGAKVIPALLARIGDGETDEEALAELTGKPLDLLETEFRQWGRSEHRAFDNKGIIRYDTNEEYEPMVRFSKRANPKR